MSGMDRDEGSEVGARVPSWPIWQGGMRWPNKCTMRCRSNNSTHLQRLKRYVYPSDGLGCLGVITGKVWDDTPRCGGYQTGRVHLE